MWIDTLERVGALATSSTHEQLAAPIAAADGRTIPDLLALLSGLIDDALDGTVRGLFDVGHTSGSVGELVARLRERAPRVAEMIHSNTETIRLVSELASVEQDIRSALDQHGARDDDAVVLSIEYLAGVLAQRLSAAGVPGLRLTCEQWGYDTAVTCHEILVADRFELFRAMNGRRSADEVRRWMWSSDPASYLPHLAVWGSLRDTDLDEIDPSIPPEYAARLRGQNWREPVTR